MRPPSNSWEATLPAHKGIIKIQSHVYLMTCEYGRQNDEPAERGKQREE